MFCKYCGKEVNVGAQYCHNCGKKLIDSKDNAKENQGKSNDNGKVKYALVWLGFGLFAIFIMLVGVGSKVKDIGKQEVSTDSVNSHYKDENTNESDKEKAILGNFKTDMYWLTIPDSWEGIYSYETWQNPNGGYTVGFYENKDKEIAGGYVFGIGLYCYDCPYGSIEAEYKGVFDNKSDGKVYDIVVTRATDIEFTDEGKADYDLMTNDIDKIISSMKSFDGEVVIDNLPMKELTEEEFAEFTWNADEKLIRISDVPPEIEYKGRKTIVEGDYTIIDVPDFTAVAYVSDLKNKIYSEGQVGYVLGILEHLGYEDCVHISYTGIPIVGQDGRDYSEYMICKLYPKNKETAERVTGLSFDSDVYICVLLNVMETDYKGEEYLLLSIFDWIGDTYPNHIGGIKPEDDAYNASYTDDELCEMALDYYEVQTGYRPLARIDSVEGDIVTIQLYDDMGDHTASSDWYYIDKNTLKGTNLLGEEVSLQ